jgi:hypothetical protein
MKMTPTPTFVPGPSPFGRLVGKPNAFQSAYSITAASMLQVTIADFVLEFTCLTRFSFSIFSNHAAALASSVAAPLLGPSPSTGSDTIVVDSFTISDDCDHWDPTKNMAGMLFYMYDPDQNRNNKSWTMENGHRVVKAYFFVKHSAPLKKKYPNECGQVHGALYKELSGQTMEFGNNNDNQAICAGFAYVDGQWKFGSLCMQGNEKRTDVLSTNFDGVQGSLETSKYANPHEEAILRQLIQYYIKYGQGATVTIPQLSLPAMPGVGSPDPANGFVPVPLPPLQPLTTIDQFNDLLRAHFEHCNFYGGTYKPFADHEMKQVAKLLSSHAPSVTQGE